MASESKTRPFRIGFLGRPFRIGFLGLSSEGNQTINKFTASLQSFTPAALVKVLGNTPCDEVQISTLDGLPVKLLIEGEGDNDDDKQVLVKIPKYEALNKRKASDPFGVANNPFANIGTDYSWSIVDSRTKEEDDDASQFYDLDQKTLDAIIEQFVQQYAATNKIRIWLVPPEKIHRPPDGFLGRLIEAVMKSAPGRIVTVASMGTLKLMRGFDQSNPFAPGKWKPVYPDGIISQTGADVTFVSTKRGISIRVLLDGEDATEEHKTSFFNWMFTLHKSHVSQQISQGSHQQLPQTLEDLVADYSMSGKHCSTMPKKKKWSLP
jgi:hypothetical protein